MKRFICILLAPFLSWSQTEPVEALHKNPPRVWALTHAIIHTEPGTFIQDGNIIIRDGQIEKVGKYIQLPNDAYEIDLEGAHGVGALNHRVGRRIVVGEMGQVDLHAFMPTVKSIKSTG